jgi:hypothetical protein
VKFSKKAIAVLTFCSFPRSRQKRDHLILTKPCIIRPVVIKTSPHKVAVTHIMTNLRTAGISRERYFELLDEI